MDYNNSDFCKKCGATASLVLDPLSNTFTCKNPVCEWFGQPVKMGYAVYSSTYRADQARYVPDMVREPIWFGISGYRSFGGVYDAACRLRDSLIAFNGRSALAVARCDELVRQEVIEVEPEPDKIGELIEKIARQEKLFKYWQESGDYDEGIVALTFLEGMKIELADLVIEERLTKRIGTNESK